MQIISHLLNNRRRRATLFMNWMSHQRNLSIHKLCNTFFLTKRALLRASLYREDYFQIPKYKFFKWKNYLRTQNELKSFLPFSALRIGSVQLRRLNFFLKLIARPNKKIIISNKNLTKQVKPAMGLKKKYKLQMNLKQNSKPVLLNYIIYNKILRTSNCLVNPTKFIKTKLSSQNKLDKKSIRFIEGIYSSYWLGRFVNMFVQSGKKKLVIKQFKTVCLMLKYRYNISPLLLLNQVLEKLKPVFLLRIIKRQSIKRAKRSTLLEYPFLASNSQKYLKVLQWIKPRIILRKKKQNSKKNKKIIDVKGPAFLPKVYNTFVNLLETWDEQPLKEKLENHHLAVSNYALRYEWGTHAAKEQKKNRRF